MIGRDNDELIGYIPIYCALARIAGNTASRAKVSRPSTTIERAPKRLAISSKSVRLTPSPRSTVKQITSADRWFDSFESSFRTKVLSSPPLNNVNIFGVH